MQISIYIPPRLLALVDLHAKRRSVSRSALITQTLRALVGDGPVSVPPADSSPDVVDPAR